MARYFLMPRECYIGQTVFFVAWYQGDGPPEIGQPWWRVYKPRLSPHIEHDVVEKLSRDFIFVEKYGKCYCPSSCQLNAVLFQYRQFIENHIEECGLDEASRVLLELAELEFGLHQASRLSVRSRMEAMNGTHPQP